MSPRITLALLEQLVDQTAAQSAVAYRRRVRWLALVYLTLNASSAAIVVILGWRLKHFVTLTQRSNVETLTLLIVLALAVNYLATTSHAVIGAARMALYNLPYLWNADPLAVETRKHAALPTSHDPQIVYFDRAVASSGGEGPVVFDCADAAGRLGTVTIRGVEVRYDPEKAGLNNFFFEYLLRRIQCRLVHRDPQLHLHIAFWNEIRGSAASAYHSTVQAFRNLEAQLGKGSLWPVARLEPADVEDIENDLRAIVPALRNEAFLPDVEYEAEYSVPVLPQPLAFIQLRRTEDRADPIATMGCAAVVMTVVLAVLIAVLAWPPWVPSK